MSAADVSLSFLRGAIAPALAAITGDVRRLVAGMDAHQQRLQGKELEAWLAARGDMLTSSVEMHAEGMSNALAGCVASLQAQARRAGQ